MINAVPATHTQRTNKQTQQILQKSQGDVIMYVGSDDVRKYMNAAMPFGKVRVKLNTYCFVTFCFFGWTGKGELK